MTNPRKSYRAIARNLGVDELTVGERIHKLQRIGFLKGWMLFFNPKLLGLCMAQVLIEVEPSHRVEMIRRLKQLESVLAVVEHLGSSMYVVISGENERSILDQVKLLDSLANTSSLIVRVPFPGVNLRLSPTDVQIIKSLGFDPRKRYSAVASGLKLSSRTVKRRLERLVEARAIFAIPSIDPGALEGAVLADLLVTYSGGEDLGRVNKELLLALDDSLVRAQLGDSDHAFFNLFVSRLSAIRDVLERVESIRGVRQARIDVVQRRLEFFDHLSNQIERRLIVLHGLQSQTKTLCK